MQIHTSKFFGSLFTKLKKILTHWVQDAEANKTSENQARMDLKRDKKNWHREPPKNGQRCRKLECNPPIYIYDKAAMDRENETIEKIALLEAEKKKLQEQITRLEDERQAARISELKDTLAFAQINRKWPGKNNVMKRYKLFKEYTLKKRCERVRATSSLEEKQDCTLIARKGKV